MDKPENYVLGRGRLYFEDIRRPLGEVINATYRATATFADARKTVDAFRSIHSAMYRGLHAHARKTMTIRGYRRWRGKMKAARRG